ncbi:hypothetical protein QBC46DRAFT_83603 [Diplogelasinospora grovesii]|uniref:Ecp2 effector protein domain-containing protein n=1 Tax=Diplogelasinospora grovesii TaxID=303347 RepID=A0AAN6MXX7_9PEZI|nr:hypothetical protein QBC46DRAFT_83603 [Diplogelasinospora grovesii]
MHFPALLISFLHNLCHLRDFFPSFDNPLVYHRQSRNRYITQTTTTKMIAINVHLLALFFILFSPIHILATDLSTHLNRIIPKGDGHWVVDIASDTGNNNSTSLPVRNVRPAHTVLGARDMDALGRLSKRNVVGCTGFPVNPESKQKAVSELGTWCLLNDVPPDDNASFVYNQIRVYVCNWGDVRSMSCSGGDMFDASLAIEAACTRVPNESGYVWIPTDDAYYQVYGYDNDTAKYCHV